MWVEFVLGDELDEKCSAAEADIIVEESRSSAVHPDPSAALPRACLRMRDLRHSLSTMTWGASGGQDGGGVCGSGRREKNPIDRIR